MVGSLRRGNRMQMKREKDEWAVFTSQISFLWAMKSVACQMGASLTFYDRAPSFLSLCLQEKTWQAIYTTKFPQPRIYGVTLFW